MINILGYIIVDCFCLAWNNLVFYYEKKAALRFHSCPPYEFSSNWITIKSMAITILGWTKQYLGIRSCGRDNGCRGSKWRILDRKSKGYNDCHAIDAETNLGWAGSGSWASSSTRRGCAAPAGGGRASQGGGWAARCSPGPARPTPRPARRAGARRARATARPPPAWAAGTSPRGRTGLRRPSGTPPAGCSTRPFRDRSRRKTSPRRGHRSRLWLLRPPRFVWEYCPH